jgi:RNA polymerase sigma-70 factor (ECF subfamily)
MDSTSVSLLEKLREPRQADAWARFVDLYTPLLFHWARRRGLREQDAADLVQDIFTHLLKKMRTFKYDPQKSFRSWLLTVTQHLWQENRRKAASAPMATDAELAGLAIADTAEAIWKAEYDQHLYRRALELMKADFQETTWRACWEQVVNGRRAADVAAELGITLGAAQAAKFRVLARLREELAGLLD